MSMELADCVAGLEIGQAQANQNVRPTDDQDGEVQQVEQERERRREGREHEDRDGYDELELSDHRVPRVVSRFWR
jgi:hypothetical protein